MTNCFADSKSYVFVLFARYFLFNRSTFPCCRVLLERSIILI